MRFSPDQVICSVINIILTSVFYLLLNFFIFFIFYAPLISTWTLNYTLRVLCWSSFFCFIIFKLQQKTQGLWKFQESKNGSFKWLHDFYKLFDFHCGDVYVYTQFFAYSFCSVTNKSSMLPGCRSFCVVQTTKFLICFQVTYRKLILLSSSTSKHFVTLIFSGAALASFSVHYISPLDI